MQPRGPPLAAPADASGPHTNIHLQIGSGNRKLCPAPASRELHLLGAARAVLGRRHSDRQGGCPVPALGAPVRLRDVRPRRKYPWEEVIWGTRLTSGGAGQKFRRPLPPSRGVRMQDHILNVSQQILPGQGAALDSGPSSASVSLLVQRVQRRTTLLV